MKKLNLQVITFSELKSTFNMKNKDTRNRILEKEQNKIGSDFKLHKRDNISSTNSAIAKSQPKKLAQWVGFVHKHFSDSHARGPPKTILDHLKKK